MLKALLRLPKENGGIKAIVYYSEGEPLYIWSRNEVEPEKARELTRNIRELASVLRDLHEVIWEGESGVYVLKPAGRGVVLTVLDNWRSLSFYRATFHKLFSKS